MPGRSWFAVEGAGALGVVEGDDADLAVPALMVTFPPGVPVNFGVTWTVRCSACSWPDLTLAADSFSVVVVGSAVTVSVFAPEAEAWKAGLPA